MDKENFKSIFNKFYDDKNFYYEHEDAIFKLEIKFYYYLTDKYNDEDNLPETINNYLMKKPANFFIELLSYTYVDKTLTEEEKNKIRKEKNHIAELAFDIIQKFKWIPNIEWIESAKKLGEDVKFDNGFIMYHIGEMLSCSKEDESDHLYPNKNVREIISKYYDEDLHRGFVIKKENSRGSYWHTNGKAEKELSDYFKKSREGIEGKYYGTKRILECLEKDYKNIAEREKNSENIV